MSRQEIFGLGAGKRGTGRDEACGALNEAKRKFRDTAQPGLWLGIQPLRDLDLDPEDPLFERIVVDPSVTGNRRSGWHFARSSRRPGITRDGIEWGFWSETLGRYVEMTRVGTRGEIRCSAAIERLYWKDGEKELSPLKMLEYPISTFRIARTLYEGRLGRDEEVVADLALFGSAGLGLREGTPGDFFFGNELARTEEPDLVWEPLPFTFAEIAEFPDRCGFRLIRRLYHAFGWREVEMPRQYDTRTGRLILPE